MQLTQTPHGQLLILHLHTFLALTNCFGVSFTSFEAEPIKFPL